MLGSFFFIFRRWRKVGEQPILWSQLELEFNVFKEGRGKEQWEVDGEGRVLGPLVEGPVRPRYVGGSSDSVVDICGWTEKLIEVLTMPRLQSLEHLTLSFFYMGKILWQECMHFLQLVSDFAPSVKKLHWEEGAITVTPNPTPLDELAQQLVAKLTNFEEVHFSSSFCEDFPHYFFPDEHPPRFGNGINAAIHRVLAALFYGKDSKLKMLTLEGLEPSHSVDLVEARKKLKVNIVSRVVCLDREHVGGVEGGQGGEGDEGYEEGI